jgi:Tol biopolymer transport system component
MKLEKSLLLLTLGVLLLACNGASGSGKPPDGSSRSGTLIYQKVQKLYAVDMATNKTRLALDLPVLSESLVGTGLGPNGEIALAYNSSTTGPTSRITIYKADGTVEGTSQHQYMIETTPRFSADGSKLTYTVSVYTSGANKRYSTQVISRDGKELYYYVNSRSPSWLPDERLVYKSLIDNNLYLSDADYTKPSRLIPNTLDAGAPHISPDGMQIVFSKVSTANTQRHLYMVNLDGSGQRQVTTSQYGEESLAVFSPNGKELLVSSYSCVSAGSGAPVFNDSDVLHIIPASATMLDIPLGTNSGAQSEQRDESGATRCSIGAPSWR